MSTIASSLSTPRARARTYPPLNVRTSGSLLSSRSRPLLLSASARTISSIVYRSNKVGTGTHLAENTVAPRQRNRTRAGAAAW